MERAATTAVFFLFGVEQANSPQNDKDLVSRDSYAARQNQFETSPKCRFPTDDLLPDWFVYLFIFVSYSCLSICNLGDVVVQWLVYRKFESWPVHPSCVLRQNT